MKRKQKRTHIIGALIFVALVAIAGFGLVATGNFHNPLNFFGGDMGHQGGPGAPIDQAVNNNADRGPGAFTFRTANNSTGRGQGFTPDHPGAGGGPDDNNGGIAWNQIGSVSFDLWFLSAIVACYILVQQMLGLIINLFPPLTKTSNSP